ncbi:hypothetical protein FVER14953_21429 [Fusarium verticillioides]|nr:hypothetical protein FVER14953_21429 [Fusarium verticillioides]
MGTALYSASDHGRLDIVMHLLEKGADVNAQTGSGTALQAASASGHFDTVMFLLENGADIDAHGGRNYNALQWASRSGHLDVVDYLLTKGADVNAQQEEYHGSSLAYLGAWGSARSSGEENFGRPLHLASYFGHLDIVIRLLEKGADVNAPGGYYGTAICAAASSGHFNIVTRLVEEGAVMDAPARHHENASYPTLTPQQHRGIIKSLRKSAGWY